MNEPLHNLKQLFESYPPYKHIFEAYRLMFKEEEYAEYSHLRCCNGKIHILDEVDYSSSIYANPLPLERIISAFDLEPGYGSADGSSEMGDIVRRFEEYRAMKYAESCGGSLKHPRILKDATVGIGSGVTGSLSLAISSIASFSKNVGLSSRNRLYYQTPGYDIVNGIANACNLQGVPLFASTNNHLIDIDSLVNSIDDRALGYVLTYPSNPAQHCYSSQDILSLTRLISRCQEAGVFLIVDNIFQDMHWRGGLCPEIFALCSSNHYLIKVYGPSKDRPFASGLKVGYLIGDSRLQKYVHDSACMLLDSANFFSRLWLAFDLIFRMGHPSQKSLSLLANSFLFGNHIHQYTWQTVLNRITNKDIYFNYVSSLEKNKRRLNTEIERVHSWLYRSPFYHVDIRPRFGNTLWITIKKPCKLENNFHLFCKALFEANIGILTGYFLGFPEEWNEMGFRVVVGAESSGWIIERLVHLQNILTSRPR